MNKSDKCFLSSRQIQPLGDADEDGRKKRKREREKGSKREGRKKKKRKLFRLVFMEHNFGEIQLVSQ